MPASITKTEYSSLDAAYEFFNQRLFDGALSACLITLNRKANARGYFAPDRFAHRQQDEHTDEIALNPDNFLGRTDEEILSTLVHEMAHVARHRLCQKPGTQGYHDKEWSSKMQQIGLMPSHTGQPGGKKTGSQMTHYIVTGGPFQIAAQELLATGWRLSWQSPSGLRKAVPKSKIKYSCPECRQNCWAKPEAHLICGDCEQTLEPRN
jgi:predicted SprT family Zn-dependent metalloprotease